MSSDILGSAKRYCLVILIWHTTNWYISLQWLLQLTSGHAYRLLLSRNTWLEKSNSLRFFSSIELHANHAEILEFPGWFITKLINLLWEPTIQQWQGFRHLQYLAHSCVFIQYATQHTAPAQHLKAQTSPASPCNIAITTASHTYSELTDLLAAKYILPWEKVDMFRN